MREGQNTRCSELSQIGKVGSGRPSVIGQYLRCIQWKEENTDMSSTTHSANLPAEVKTQLQQTLADLVSGVRNAEKMKAACRRMDQMREENRRLLGEQNIAADLIREVRDRS
jgi:hypothetical protein